MKHQTINKLVNLLKPKDRRSIVEWAESKDGIDFSLVPSYDCSYPRHFSIALLPFWEEPLNNITDRSCKEQVIVKCTRAGGSMSILETALRYTIAVDPKSCLYVTGSKDSCESFFKLRICRGMKLSPMTAAKYSRSRVYDTQIQFDEMRFLATYPGSRMFGKADSWSLILCDEVSAYMSTESIAALRTRQVTVPFSHLILISSPDTNTSRNSVDDPIWIEFQKGDRREWHCKDPKTGNRFVFKMGGRKGKQPGLKIPQDAKDKNGKWNYNAIRRDVYYLTPDGTRIYEKDRMAVVATGIWIPTKKDLASIEPGRKSYHMNAFLLPWYSLGEIGAKWIEANQTSKAEVRSFIMNFLGEQYYESRVELKGNEVIYERSANYQKGDQLLELDEFKNKYKEVIDNYIEKHKNKQNVIKNPVLIVTADVQKTNLWVLSRLWFSTGDSYLMDYRSVPTFDDLVDYIDTVKPSYVGVDSNYQDRRVETLDYCYKHRMMPMIGAVAKMKNLLDVTEIDPYSGTRYAGKKKVNQIMFNSSGFKDILFELISDTRFNGWFIYQNPSNQYVNQLNSERKIDSKWVAIKSDNHSLDCEVMSLAIAHHIGYLNPAQGE